MRKIRVLIVDDSVFSQNALTHCLSSDESIEVVGVASNGREALEMIGSLDPDILTLDVEMPEMDGLTTLRLLRKSRPTLPVIMCSALTERGATATLEALAEGATCYVTKPNQGHRLEENLDILKADLLPKIKALGPAFWSQRRSARGGHSAAKFLRSHLAQPVQSTPQKSPQSPASRVSPPPHRPPSLIGPAASRIDLVVIAASTGGPAALATILPRLPKDLPVPVAIVQHMPSIFTKLLAQRLSDQSPLPVQEALHGQPLKAGSIVLAPGGYHLRVTKNASGPIATLDQEAPNQFCRPSANCLFESAAFAFGENVLGVVLTGMGNDGTEGCRTIRSRGGQIVAQDEASSVIWGMPRTVVEQGLANSVLPLNEIAREISRRVTLFRRSRT